MNGRPSSTRVFGSPLVADPYTPPFKPYVYNGAEKLGAPSEDYVACSLEDCAGKVYARGLCSTHHKKQRRGVPMDADGRKKQFDPSFCGTVSGYGRHRNHDIPLCRPCRDAKNAYDRARRAGTTRKKEGA